MVIKASSIKLFWYCFYSMSRTLGSIISKDGGSTKDVKSRIAKAQGVFSLLKKVWKIWEISLKTKIRRLEATAMTVVKYGSEAWALQKADENSLDVFQRNCLHIVLGTQLTDHISNSRLYEKCGSILLSRAIIIERLRWLGHILQMKDDRLPKIGLLGLHRKQVVLVWVGMMSEIKI